MEINNYSNKYTRQYQKPNFGAVKVDSVNLLKKTGTLQYSPIKADFLELKPTNKGDIKIIKDLEESWKKLTKYGHVICSNFLDKKKNARFFVTQVKDGAEKKITNIMELNSGDKGCKYLELAYLQSAPDIANKQCLSPIKGSGEIALYETAKIAKKGNYDGFSLYSTNDFFYEKAGMEAMNYDDMLTTFKVRANKLDDFMKRIAEKYKLGK